MTGGGESASSGESAARSGGLARITPCLAPLLGVALTARLVLFARRFASDVIFWDQWDFLNPLFQEHGLFAMFRQQHGPHRQGLGGLLLGVLYPLTHWDARVDAFVAIAALALSAALIIFCARRLAGRPHWSEPAIALLFIEPTASAIFAGPTNPAHGPLPLLLACGAAATLTLERRTIRALLLGLIGACAVYTAFALLLAPVIALLLLVDLVHSLGSRPRDTLAPALSLLAVAISAASFFIGYTFTPALACYQFPDPHPWLYLPFAGLQLLRPYATFAQHLGAPVVLIAALAFLAGLALALDSLRRTLRRAAARDDGTIFLLAAFSVLFAFESAVGRVCLGLELAGSSRYVTYALPLAAAIYLRLRTAKISPLTSSLGLAAMVAIGAVVCSSQRASTNEARMFKTWREAWADCYLASHDLAACDQKTKPIYPDAAATGMQQKLDWMEAGRRSFFRAGR